MTQIKIFHPETYPDKIKIIRNELFNFSNNAKNELIHTKYLHDYTSRKLWDLNSEFGKLHTKLMNSMIDNEIVAYHNTRLLHPSKITDNGLIFSDERYICSLKEDMYHQNISEKLVGDIISKLIKEQERWKSGGINQRKNEICFFYDLDYYKEYEKFLSTYGGEFLESVLLTIKKTTSLNIYKPIAKIGKPYIVEFAIPFSLMDLYQRQDIARYMLEEWIHLDIKKDNPEHQYDGRIEFEIPAEKIICMYEVDDNFSNIDEWLFN